MVFFGVSSNRKNIPSLAWIMDAVFTVAGMVLIPSVRIIYIAARNDEPTFRTLSMRFTFLT